MKPPKHVLVFRFSALGDVAMTVPVIKLVLQQNPHLNITFVSNGFVQPLFEGINRLQFFAVEPKGKHKGIKGIYKLSQELKKSASFDAVADLHNVLRTKMLRTFFSFSGFTISVINKGRNEKKELTRIKHKKLRPLKSTFQRYAEVFEKLGLPVNLNEFERPNTPSFSEDLTQLKSKGFKLVGVAPFAKHAEKMYPLQQIQEVIELLISRENIIVYLFGSKDQASLLDTWHNGNNIISLAGKMSLQKELEAIAALDIMVTMDSANMHLASLSGVPVVSVWGSTHPFAGFYGWQQPLENAVQVDLYCRPCSVFGNRKCYRGDLACLHSINPETIVKKVQTVLNKD